MGVRARNKPVVAIGFKGMNNLPRESAVLVDRKYIATPTIVSDALISDGGKLTPREGYTKLANVPGLHSIWAGSVMLGVGIQDNTLYRIDGANLNPLVTFPGFPGPLRYTEILDTVYVSSPNVSCVYEPLRGIVRSFGVTLPAHPRLEIVPGDLPPGTYTLAYTRTEYGQMSGNGPLTQVRWEGDARGIRLVDYTSDLICWMTHANGRKLQLARVDGSGNILGTVPDSETLLPFMVAPPPKFADLCYAFGRIWGISGHKLYYSFPTYLEWFRSSDFKALPEELVMVAAANTGVFVSSLKSTWFLSGTDPDKMEVSRCGEGAIPGTLTYAPMAASLAGGAATSASFGTMSQMPTPVWLSPTGFVVGTHTGHLTLITAHRLRLTARAQGASYYQMVGGAPRIVTSMHGEAVSDDGDPELQKIFEKGRLV